MRQLGVNTSRHGLVHVYTGSGKGKTTAALGLALRAAGHGWRVCMIMFLKGKYRYGERLSARHIPGLEVTAYGRKELIRGRPTHEDIKEAERGLRHARQAINSKQYDLVILDELTHAINLGLLRLDEVMRLVNEKPGSLELVITGRDSPPELARIADYVSEIVERKHPYKRGIRSRKGIEF